MALGDAFSVGGRRQGLTGFPFLMLLPALWMATVMTVWAASANSGERPNVVVIMTDDQGYGDFGVMGNPVVETPQMDAMAGRGFSFDRCYVHPVCAPTRASLMTGRNTYRTRVVDTWLGRAMMEPDEVTVAEVLRDAGYATGIFGKWHLGDNHPMRPHDQGFEMALVHKGGGLAQPSEPPENNRRYTDPILFQNGLQVATEGYATDVYFDAAFDWMEHAQNQGRPFFVYLPTNAPHGPFHDVPEDLYESYLEKDLASVLLGEPNDNRVDRLAGIFAMITNVDENIGRLFEKLEAMGVRENTMVMFLVDNGPNGRRYVGPLRGRKGGVLEGGIRSPLWIDWPARLSESDESDRIVAHIDLMPTILEACGVPPPDGVELDGRSLLPLMTQEDPEWPDRTIFIQSHRGNEPVRYHHFAAVTQTWKLVHPSGFGRHELPDEDPSFELYNLEKDPGEEHNRAADHPEIVDRLKSDYDAWFDDVSSTRPDNYAPPRISVGTPHENPVVLTRQDWRYEGNGGGWRRNAIGYWLLSAPEAGRYDIRFRFDPEDRPGRAMLKVDGEGRERPLSAGASECTFVDVPLSAGEMRLDAVLSHEGDQRGVWQVDVLRR